MRNRKPIYFILLVVCVLSGSCKKISIPAKSDAIITRSSANNQSQYIKIPNEGEYNVEHGGITINAADTTIFFTAPQDTIILVTQSYAGVAAFKIRAYQAGQRGRFIISSGIERKSGAVSTVGDFYLNETIGNQLIYDFYTYYGTGYGGPFKIETFSTAGTLLKGTFDCNVMGRFYDRPFYRTPIDKNGYTKCTGSFNLDLNVKR